MQVDRLNFATCARKITPSRRFKGGSAFKTHASAVKRRPSGDDEPEKDDHKGRWRGCQHMQPASILPFLVPDLFTCFLSTVNADQTTRREIILGAVNLAVLGDAAAQIDGRTVVNSLLGAYGLPAIIPAAKGFTLYDDFDNEYVFEYPKSWVQRKNTLRPGIYIADFNTADKLTVETFQMPLNIQKATANREFVEAVISKLINPSSEIGGDARLELPSEKSIKTSVDDIDGQTYVYIRFPSQTTTRSGYDITRKNIAVAAVKKGTVYTMGVSARQDQYNKEKEQLLKYTVESFRLR